MTTMRTSTLFVAVMLSIGAALAGDNWPQFRGPTGQGVSDAVGLPLTWSENENVVWKTPIHGRAWSSPVVWGGQVWMTTAEENGSTMYVVCVDRDSGKVLRDIALWTGIVVTQEMNPLNSFASPTPAIEEGRVYVHFGVYGTACLDTKTGAVLWQRRDIHCDHFRGPGSSPILYGDLLILTMDGIDVQYLVALDKRTGQNVWKTSRPAELADLDPDLRKAYTTPLVIAVDGQKQLVSTGAMYTLAYEPATGKEIWRVRHGGFSNTSRPVFGDGLVFVNSGFARSTLWAVRPDGRGDVSDTHTVWKCSKSMPLKPSPVFVDGLLFAPGDQGILSCVDAKTGESIWTERVGGQFSASPLHADGRVYFFDHDGRTIVVAPGREYKALAENRLDAGCMASPAVAGKAIFLRTKTHLYRLEK